MNRCRITCAAASLCIAALVGSAGQVNATEKQEVELLISGAEAALLGDKTLALRNLQKAAILHPNSTDIQATLGYAALLLGDFSQARRVLERLDQPSYYAMALVHEPGGFAKAKSVLAQSTKTKTAHKSSFFLAALAFHNAGQPKKADRLLAKALEYSKSALDEAFSPDPAVALARAVRRFVAGREIASRTSLRLAHALYRSGRRGEAYRWAQSAIEREELTSAALRVLVLIENISYSRQTLRRVQAVLKEEPDSHDACVAEILLLVRLKEMEKAKIRLEKLPKLKDKALQAQILEARLKIELATESIDRELLVTAEEALRASPKSNSVLALMIETLIRINKLDRAKAFAVTLAKRKPSDVDPYILLHRIQKKRGKKRDLAHLKARSKLLQKSILKIEKTAERREEVIRAVRQAEYSSVSASTLQAVRRESPALSLPVDLAIGRLGSRGQARAARDRILAACGPHLKSFLLNRRGSDWVTISTNPYGQLEQAEVPLSAANPSRCKTKVLKRR